VSRIVEFICALRGANHVFAPTTSRLARAVFGEIFDLKCGSKPRTADFYFDTINAALHTPPSNPRVIRAFGIECWRTTEGASTLCNTRTIARLAGEVGYYDCRRTDVTDPERTDFNDNVRRLAQLTGRDRQRKGYLAALQRRRAFLREHGDKRQPIMHRPRRRRNYPERQAKAFSRVCIAGRCGRG